MINFRDLADSHKSLRKGMIYRAAGPLFSGNHPALNRVHTWIDLRSESEWETCTLPIFPLRKIVPMDLADARFCSVEKPSPNDWAGMYKRGFERNTQNFVEILENILTSPKPVLFSCAVGRDRTGVVAALVLYLLGADRESIIRDYCQTSESARALAAPYLTKCLKPGISEDEYIASYFTCVPPAIEPLLDYFYSNGNAVLDKLAQFGFSKSKLDDLRRQLVCD